MKHDRKIVYALLFAKMSTSFLSLGEIENFEQFNFKEGNIKANIILHIGEALKRSIVKSTFTSTNLLYHFIKTRIQILPIRNEHNYSCS